jgi:hypothetical protein
MTAFFWFGWNSLPIRKPNAAKLRLFPPLKKYPLDINGSGGDLFRKSPSAPLFQRGD